MSVKLFLSIIGILLIVALPVQLSAEVVYRVPLVIKKIRATEQTKKPQFRKKLKWGLTIKQKHRLLQKDWSYPLAIVSFFSSVVGVFVYIIGAVLLNPLIWGIGLGVFLAGAVGLLLLLAFLDTHWTYWSVLKVLTMVGAGIGITLFTIGVVLGTLALWVGGLSFVFPLVLYFLIWLIKIEIPFNKKKSTSE